MTQTQDPSNRTLGQLNDEDRYRAFDDLQLSMGSAWDSIQKNLADESVVVVPSISIERTTASSGTVTQAMEERALFLLLLLRQPRLRMIYVTSQPISEAIIEYYLGLLPGVIPSHARARLTLVSVGDASADVAQFEAAGAATAAAGDPVADPEPGAVPSDPVQHHRRSSGMSRCRLAFRCTGPIPGSSTSAARPAAAGCSRSARCSIRSGRRTSTRSTTSWPAVQGMRARRPSISRRS